MTQAETQDAAIGQHLDFGWRAVTGEDIRALIERDSVLRGSYGKPSASALEGVANAVSVLRGRVRTGTDAYLTPEQLLNDQRKKDASEALATLARVLPGLREDILTAPDVGPPDISDLLRLGTLSQLDALQDTVNEAWEYGWLIPHQELSIQVTVGAEWTVQYSEAYALPPPSHDREIFKWHFFATLLADRFRDVVKARNVSLPRLANSNGGPVARFLVAVIPHITGETPTPDAVRKWLRDHPTGDKPK